MHTFQPHSALLIVDAQNDFFPPMGALPVPKGKAILPVLNAWIAHAQRAGIPILMSRDWHPVHHCSFEAQGGIWPSHCIQNTKGSDFHPELMVSSNVVIINKGTSEASEAYSAFEGTLTTTEESLAHYLNAHHIQHLWIGGLALDFCVKATILSARAAGFDVHLILSATQAISEEGEKETLALLKEKGVYFV